MAVKSSQVVPDEVVIDKIYLIRGMKVMLDRDMAKLYGVATRRLKEQVRRNIDRFPEDFMFEMTTEELENWRSQFATSNREVMGLRRPPFVFTEHGVLMLSSVLNSSHAIQMNIRIMRIFTKMKEMLLNHKDLLLKIEQIERKMSGHDHSLVVLFEHLKKLLEERQVREKLAGRKRIGFKRDPE
jgi:hypothetical protein